MGDLCETDQVGITNCYKLGDSDNCVNKLDIDGDACTFGQKVADKFSDTNREFSDFKGDFDEIGGNPCESEGRTSVYENTPYFVMDFGGDDADDKWGVMCGKSKEEWSVENIHDCCLNRDPIEDAEEMKKCPVSYHNKYEEESGDRVYTRQCDTFYKKICTGKTAWINKIPSEERANISRYCSEWGDAFPYKAMEGGRDLCFGTDLSDDDATKEHFQEKMRTMPGICRQYVQTHNDVAGPLLNKMCEVNFSEDDNFQAILDKLPDELKDICHCNLPSRAYTKWKDENLNDTEKSTIGLNVKPECFYPECQASKLYDTSGETGGCPNIQTCIQSIVNNIGGDHTEPIDPSELGDQQECNLSAIHQETTTDAGTGESTTRTTDETGTTSADTSPGIVSTNRVVNEGTQINTNMIFRILLGVICCGLVLFSIRYIINSQKSDI